MMHLLRFAKLLSVALLFAGSLGATMGDTLAARRRMALFVAAPSLLATWGLGIALASNLDETLLSTWVLASIALSLVAINVVLFAVAKEGRNQPILAAITWRC